MIIVLLLSAAHAAAAALPLASGDWVWVEKSQEYRYPSAEQPRLRFSLIGETRTKSPTGEVRRSSE